MIKDKYHIDENDFEGIEDFERFYGLEQDDEPIELDFNNHKKKLNECYFINEEEMDEN